MQSFVAQLPLRCVLGIFRELITTTTTTRVAFWDPASWKAGSKIRRITWRADIRRHTLRSHLTVIRTIAPTRICVTV